MADFTETKDGYGSNYPEDVEDSEFKHCEPLITPKKLKSLHLFGIPLVSRFKGVDGKPEVLDEPLLKEFILEAVSLIELESTIHISQKTVRERHPFDRKANESFGYLRLRQGPVNSIQSLSITSSDSVDIYQVPLQWIDTGNLHRRQINIHPFNIAALSGGIIPIQNPAASGILPSLYKFNWVPGLWDVNYSVGFKNNKYPKTINQLIGVVAAMEILSQLAATNARANSMSLGIDGLSQSMSFPGPQVYEQRLEELGAKRQWLVKKLKNAFGLGLLIDSI